MLTGTFTLTRVEKKAKIKKCVFPVASWKELHVQHVVVFFLTSLMLDGIKNAFLRAMKIVRVKNLGQSVNWKHTFFSFGQNLQYKFVNITRNNCWYMYISFNKSVWGTHVFSSFDNQSAHGTHASLIVNCDYHYQADGRTDRCRTKWSLYVASAKRRQHNKCHYQKSVTFVETDKTLYKCVWTTKTSLFCQEDFLFWVTHPLIHASHFHSSFWPSFLNPILNFLWDFFILST